MVDLQPAGGEIECACVFVDGEVERLWPRLIMSSHSAPLKKKRKKKNTHIQVCKREPNELKLLPFLFMLLSTTIDE